MNEYKKVLFENYANFQGRAARKEYWMFFLFNLLAAAALMIVDMGLVMFVGIAGLNLLYTLGVIVPGIAVTVRRLHDTGRSGWWILLGLVPFIGIFLLVLMCLDSEPGTNEYGENPKGQQTHTAGGLATAS
ncbi:MAG: DUF805 domain-containing protein [Planctomycetota bacterium]